MSEIDDAPPAGSEWRQRNGRLPKSAARPKAKSVATRRMRRNSSTPAQKRGASKAPRPTSHSPALIQAAFLAGQGMTGAEIAAAIGGTTGPDVRAQLRRHGVKVPRGFGMAEPIAVRLSRRERLVFGTLAEAIEIEPTDLAAELLRALIAEPIVARNLLDREA
jgi:hypothetical protein